jgi:hypothetical protein
MRDTPYAKELARAEINDCRIERLWVKKLGQIEIRFSEWHPAGVAYQLYGVALSSLAGSMHASPALVR